MKRLLFRYGLLAALGATGVFADPAVQPLFEALRQGDGAKVRAAVRDGADPNSRDEYGNTLLMQAAVYGTAEDLQFLLAHGAEVKAANQAGHTAVMRAMPDLTKIHLLVEHGADINATTVTGATPLMIAASIRGAEHLVWYLIQQGADLRAVNKAGRDAIMTAAQDGAVWNLKILLEAGASGGARVKDFVTPASPRAAALDQSSKNLLKRRIEGFTALMTAAGVNCEPCVQLLLEHGADAKARTDSGLTALHRAAGKGNLPMVKLLLGAGAPVNVADDRGLTPLMLAVNSRTRNVEVVRVLLARGADAEAKDASGRSVAEWAEIGASRDIVKLLPAVPVHEAARTVVVEPKRASKDIRATVEKSIGLLEEHGPKFFPKGGCISCHNVSIPMLAITEARRRAYPVHQAAQQMAKQTTGSLGPLRDDLLSGYCTIPGITTTGSYALISVHGEGHAPDMLTDGIVRCLLVEQYPDGHWGNSGDERPPLSPESSIPGTALSARAVKLYPVPALSGKLEAAVARAREYLLSAKPRFGDDYAYRLLGLFWTGARDGAIKASADDLVAQQHTDGGWAQTPDMAPDAYATGLALSALSMTEPGRVNSEAYRRGVVYLLRTREADGSWHVRSRAFGFQPYFESGFPHGHDQWISMAATAWSVMALMPAAESPHVAAQGRTATGQAYQGSPSRDRRDLLSSLFRSPITKS